MSTKHKNSRLRTYFVLTFVVAIALYLIIFAANDFNVQSAEVSIGALRPFFVVWRIFLYAAIYGLYYYVRKQHLAAGDDATVTYLDSVRSYGLMLVAIVELTAFLRLMGLLT